MSQKRLTKNQVNEFYTGYAKLKLNGNYAGEVLTEAEWRNQMELYLNTHYPKEKWSNTRIKEASKLLARGTAWSRTQIKSLEENLIDNIESDAAQDFVDAFHNKFGKDADLRKMLRHNQSAIYQFLKSYSSDWNVYFNS